MQPFWKKKKNKKKKTQMYTCLFTPPSPHQKDKQKITFKIVIFFKTNILHA